MYDVKTETTIKGTVESVETVTGQRDPSQRETWLLSACEDHNTSRPNAPIPRVASSKSAGEYPECIALKRSHG